jgi:hypothetical protein
LPDLPDEPDGYLFLVVDKKFYAMTKKQMLGAATLIERGTGSDESEVLEALVGLGFVLADIQGPNESSDGRPDSCACVALNIDAFDNRIQEKQRKIIEARGQTLAAKKRKKVVSKKKVKKA